MNIYQSFFGKDNIIIEICLCKKISYVFTSSKNTKIRDTIVENFPKWSSNLQTLQFLLVCVVWIWNIDDKVIKCVSLLHVNRFAFSFNFFSLTTKLQMFIISQVFNHIRPIITMYGRIGVGQYASSWFHFFLPKYVMLQPVYKFTFFAYKNSLTK